MRKVGTSTGFPGPSAGPAGPAGLLLRRSPAQPPSPAENGAPTWWPQWGPRAELVGATQDACGLLARGLLPVPLLRVAQGGVLMVHHAACGRCALASVILVPCSSWEQATESSQRGPDAASVLAERQEQPVRATSWTQADLFLGAATEGVDTEWPFRVCACSQGGHRVAFAQLAKVPLIPPPALPGESFLLPSGHAEERPLLAGRLLPQPGLASHTALLRLGGGVG